ncbi:hypothetical protein ACJMK2_020490 [Sinanodonta woodiana]|uniref:Peroxisomal membrane protein PEX16 n=1 Tax=Sinanodonta woodiana TaxID=1069815 RepID=A0ABD3U1H7_SINWO
MATSNKVDKFLERLKEKYSEFIRTNPETVTQIEAAIRIFSYLIAGRIENGQVISELIYSSSNLLVLFNDIIIQSAAGKIPKLDLSKERLMRWLTVLEYLEVFLELAAHKKWGQVKAWVVIAIVQITKTIIRFALLKHGACIQSTPPIAPVDRDAVLDKKNGAKNISKDSIETAIDEDITYSEPEASTFTLVSSGRQMRKLEGAPPNSQRTWIPPTTSTTQNQSGRKITSQRQNESTVLSKQQMWAEGIHIARPLAHLISMYLFGNNGWKPWLLAAGMDVSSMCLMGDTGDLTAKEKAELKRRTLMLLYYLLRSPFYDKYSKEKITYVLKMISDHVPLTGYILRPIMDYLPVWQRVYFYVWTT